MDENYPLEDFNNYTCGLAGDLPPRGEISSDLALPFRDLPLDFRDSPPPSVFKVFIIEGQKDWSKDRPLISIHAPIIRM